MSKTNIASFLVLAVTLAGLGGCAAAQSTVDDDDKQATATTSSALDVFCHPSIKADGNLETACDPALMGGDPGGGGGATSGPDAPGGTVLDHACVDVCTEVHDDCFAACRTVSCRITCSRAYQRCEARCH